MRLVPLIEARNIAEAACLKFPRCAAPGESVTLESWGTAGGQHMRQQSGKRRKKRGCFEIARQSRRKRKGRPRGPVSTLIEYVAILASVIGLALRGSGHLAPAAPAPRPAPTPATPEAPKKRQNPERDEENRKQRRVAQEDHGLALFFEHIADFYKFRDDRHLNWHVRKNDPDLYRYLTSGSSRKFQKRIDDIATVSDVTRGTAVYYIYDDIAEASRHMAYDRREAEWRRQLAEDNDPGDDGQAPGLRPRSGP